MFVVRRLRGWLREHPAAADALLALLVFTAALPPLLDERANGPDAEASVPLIALLGAGCACLVLRRRHPWSVWAVATALGLIGVAVGQAASTVIFPAVVALYTVSARVPVWQTIWAAIGSALASAALLLTLDTVSVLDEAAYEVAPWSAFAAVSGIAVRSQRAVVEAANDRARQAEANREEEAQRRVAEERLRTARDLHDVVAHHVAVINVQAGVASHVMRDDPDTAAAAMAIVRKSSQTVLREVPGLLGLLRTGDEGLETAPVPRLEDVGGLVEQARSSGLEIVWETSGTPTSLAPSTDLTAYRVVQEGLTNAGRHGTGPVVLTVAYEPGGLAIVLRNTQARPTTEAATGRLGLIGMRERVIAAGGTLEVGPAAPGTWAVRAWLPDGPRRDELGVGGR